MAMQTDQKQRPLGGEIAETRKTRRYLRLRAILKIIVLLGVGAVLWRVGLYSVDADMLAALKTSLSLWRVLVLVVAINMVSAAVLLACYMAWRWVRRDWAGGDEHTGVLYESDTDINESPKL